MAIEHPPLIDRLLNVIDYFSSYKPPFIHIVYRGFSSQGLTRAWCRVRTQKSSRRVPAERLNEAIFNVPEDDVIKHQLSSRCLVQVIESGRPWGRHGNQEWGHSQSNQPSGNQFYRFHGKCWKCRNPWLRNTGFAASLLRADHDNWDETNPEAPPSSWHVDIVCHSEML